MNASSPYKTVPTVSPAPVQNPGLKPVRVLIAEDHISLRELLARHLTSTSRYEVVGQTDRGDDVAAECERLQPALLILDLDLAGGDGLDALAAVRTRAPDTHTLIFSAMTDAGTVRRALEAGACGYIEKTAGVEMLERAVAAVSIGQTFFGDHVLQTLPLIMRGEPDAHGRKLSAREREVLALVADGHSSREIATRLALSVRTVENHRSNIMRALGARNTADLTREALRLGLVQVQRRDRPQSA